MGDIRVLVTDDSAMIRRVVSDVIEAAPGLTVAGVAENGQVAIDRVRELRPDVVTLDIEMPVMNGLDTVAALRAQHPRLPIIMFSTLTVAGGEATLQALSLGASDFVAKPSGPGGLANALEQVRIELVPKIRALAKRAPLARIAEPVTPARSATRPASTRVECVVVGISTGGPRALEDIVPRIPRDIPVPLLVVQHMPATFTRLLAERLDRASSIAVSEATGTEFVEPGHMYIAPGEHHLTVERRGARIALALNDSPREHSCRPSADPLFRSAVGVFRSHVLGVVLTGMGEDGSGGARAITDAGGRVIVQDEATSVVWGMPGAIVRAGLADRVLPLDDIVPEIVRRTGAAAAVAPRGGAPGR